MRLGYLIPEFPGQTHIWIWREICHMREWGTQIEIFSTKPPSPDITSHDFAASEQIYYLWNSRQSIQDLLLAPLFKGGWGDHKGLQSLIFPPGYVSPNILDIFISLWWATLRPFGLFKLIWLALTIDVDARPRWISTLPLAPIACILAREAHKRGIEHFHCHSCANSAILAMMLKSLTGIPYSLTLNANLEWWGGGLDAKFSGAKFTITITEWLNREVKRQYPHLLAQVLVGRIGVDTIKWTPQRKNNYDDNKPFQIISVGRLHSSKGHDTLIQAVKTLVDAKKSVNLTIVGAGSESDNLKALVSKLELSDFVNFTGSLSENQIIEQMRLSDAFALASHAEPLGVVYMEAMAMEVPTIGTNAGGVPEIITDGQDGLLVPPRNHVALASAIELLIENPSLRQKLGRNGRLTIVKRFDSRIGAATLYQRLFGCMNNNQQLT
jgi:colanic acid/amylovoran biosynthesis glycosyltransferase